MPLPRSKDEGSGGAPVLDIMKARVKLFDVEEYTEPFTVNRKSDGATFTLDPQFKCTVEVLDDFDGGANNGQTFFEGFRYKWVKKNNRWENVENSKLGMLTKVVKLTYFDDPSIPDLTEDDLEGFEMHCRIKPKKAPDGRIAGSTIDWETMKPVPDAPTAAAAKKAAQDEEDADFDDLPPF